MTSAGNEVPAALRPALTLSVAEAFTYLAMLTLLGWRTILDGPDLSGAAGAVHGVTFLAYVGTVVAARETFGWRARPAAVLVVLAAIPFGGFAAHRRLRRLGARGRERPPGRRVRAGTR